MTKLEKFVLRWLNDNYNYMEPFLMEEYPDYIFHMKNGKCILQHNKKNGYIYVSYSEIWKFFENMFSMSNEQIKDITKIWVEEHYKVGVKATQEFGWRLQKQVDEQYKEGITTTHNYLQMQIDEVEGQYKVGVISTEWLKWITLMERVEGQYKVG